MLIHAGVVVLCAAGAEPEGRVFRGIADAVRAVDLHPATDGIVRTVEVSEGDRVIAGAALCRLDDRVASVRVELARAQAASTAEIDEREIRLADLRRRLERTEAASRDGAAPEWEVASAHAEVQIAEAQLRAANDRRTDAAARLALEEKLLEQHELTAPFDGVVTRVYVSEGEFATRGEPAVRLVNLDVLEASVFIAGELHDHLVADEMYTLTIAEPYGREIDGELTFIDPEMDPGTEMFRCTFMIPNADRALPSGVGVSITEHAIRSVRPRNASGTDAGADRATLTPAGVAPE